MTHFVQTLISGLSLGSIYALIALGYTMVYGIAKMLNFAHGDIIMVGAYAAIVAVFQMKMPGLVEIRRFGFEYCFSHFLLLLLLIL